MAVWSLFTTRREGGLDECARLFHQHPEVDGQDTSRVQSTYMASPALSIPRPSSYSYLQASNGLRISYFPQNIQPVSFPIQGQLCAHFLSHSNPPTPQPLPSPSPSPPPRHPTPPLTPTLLTFRSRHAAYHPLSLPRPTYTSIPYRGTQASTDRDTAGRPRW